MKPMDEFVVTYLTNALWMTCVIAAITCLLSRVLRHGPSSYRHALWVAALLFAVLLPFTTLHGSRTNDVARPEPVTTASMAQSAGTGPNGTSSWALWRRLRHGGQPVQFVPIFVQLVAGLYLGFIAHRAVRLYCGWRSVRAMLHAPSGKQLPPPMRTVVEHCYSLLGVEPVPIFLSADGKGPATLGIRNPVVVLPEWFLSQASNEELSSTLCHELAHIHRHDFLLNLVYELLLLPISFNPAAALIKARIDQTRELACDEMASESLFTPTQYARSLVSIAQFMAANRGPANPGYALRMFDTNTLEDRVMNVLAKGNRIRKTRARASAFATFVVLTVMCFGASVFSIQVHPSTDVNLQQFVGTWHAQFKGKTFLTIKLEKQDGKLTGTTSHADIRTDKDGELTSAEEHDGSDPIVEAKLTGGTLRITTQEQDSQDTIQCEMKLTGADQAEIRMITPPDVTAPKPWRLERASNGQ